MRPSVRSSSAEIPPPERTLGDPQQRELFRRCQQGDHAAKEALVRQYLPLARKLARRYANSSEPFEDLAQVASLGLVEAMERYDPDRGSSFPSFAVPTILGSLRRYFRDYGWSVHVPRSAQERALAVGEANERLTNLKGRAPTVEELAEHLKMSAEQTLDGLYARQVYRAQSLEEPMSSEGEEGGRAIGDHLGAEDERFELVDADVSVAGAIRSMSDSERRLLRMCFIEERTQTEVAEQLGVSQMQISRLLRQTLERLRDRAGAPRER